MSTTVLDRILEAKRRRLQAGEFRVLGTPALPSSGRRFEEALRSAAPAVIAEIKHRSPSAGTLLEGAAGRIEAVAREYRRGGAAALSVVVEQDFFGGDPSWLQRAKAASGLPALMKDFVVAEEQLDFAVSIGADAVLLIVAALDDETLESLHANAVGRGLAVLVEAHDESEVKRALAVGARIVGVNARDLRTFKVDLSRIERLGKALPTGVTRVAESGIGRPSDVRRLGAAGFGAFLVGGSLLRAADISGALRALRGEGTTEVKICGLTRESDVRLCEELGVDHIGLNFSPLSPRRISKETGARLRDAARGVRHVVAVFAGNSEAEIEEVVGLVRPDVVQLTDPPAPGAARRWPLPVWQTVHVGAPAWREALAWDGDRLLFDTAGAGRPGGTGTTFDWAALEKARPARPFMLAGGLEPENVAEAVRRIRPRGVDVASGVESAPGVKERSKVARFVEAVRSVPAPESEEG